MQSEAQLYEQFAQYLNLKYPHLTAFWHFDTGGMYTPSHIQRNLYGRLNATSRGWPDFHLALMAEYEGTTYGGLWIEMKHSNVRLQKRDGNWVTDHIAEQAHVLAQLRDRRFVAEFGAGFDQCVQIFESYIESGKLILPDPKRDKPKVMHVEIEDADKELPF